ncbi:MAG: amidohydrolase [Candidatus Delongbacteria bacterium]|nr:amidohydrolase [Candidatus Delongbacteria bacterium]
MSKYFSTLIQHRRELHKIPEICYNEHKTGDYILNILQTLNCFEIRKMAKTGLVASYKPMEGQYIAFRADMDGLKITEETSYDFKSENHGYMHACGHDLHMSMLLTLAVWISENKPLKNILLIFQPAEEGQGGGKLMVEEGLFDIYDVEEIYALHNINEFPVGSIAFNNNKMFAGTIEFEITLSGKGGHAASPHEGTDVNTAMNFLALMLNTITSRYLDPINENVLSIGITCGGEAANIIPDTSTIRGTARSYTVNELEFIKKKINDMTSGICIAYDCRSEFKLHSEYIPAINNKNIVEKLKTIKFDNNLSLIDCKPKMTGEDFSFMLDKVPGAIIWLGAGNDTNREFGLHNSKYEPDELAMEYGFELFVKLIEKI